MIAGEGGDDAGTQLVGFGIGPAPPAFLLQMLVQQPGVIDQALQDQRLAAGEGRALAAHDWAVGELRAGRLIGATAKGRRLSEAALLELVRAARARLEAR